MKEIPLVGFQVQKRFASFLQIQPSSRSVLLPALNTFNIKLFNSLQLILLYVDTIENVIYKLTYNGTTSTFKS